MIMIHSLYHIPCQHCHIDIKHAIHTFSEWVGVYLSVHYKYALDILYINLLHY